jgi:glycosyltransferase involved in cell wall biosynthesis
MSFGVPVVCADTSSLPEIAGKAAIYFSPDNQQSLITALNKAKDLTAIHRQKLISAGLVQSQKFSWQVTAEKTIKVYESVLNK